MMENKLLVAEALAQFPPPNPLDAKQALSRAMDGFNTKIVVLDDDPTGVQTVHGISVYTDWSLESIEQGFLEEHPMFFILTNSRAFITSETRQAHEEIAQNILAVSKKTGKEFLIISRGDSTLRGHYPLETETLKTTIEAQSSRKFDGEIIIPVFKEGGRLTIENTHYVQEQDYLVPAGETEFAKDRTFGYASSHLGEWIEEKTAGRYKAVKSIYISLDDLRALDIENITKQLCEVRDFNKVIVNATCYEDVMVFTAALVEAMKLGKSFLFRSAAAFTKVIGRVGDKPLLTKAELLTAPTTHGGLIMVGSHVQKTTEQLEELKKCDFIRFLEFDCHLVLFPERFQQERERIQQQCETLIASGQTVAVYTKRERLDLGENRKEEELKLSVQISDAVTQIVNQLHVRPKYIIAKGGITSSDIGTKGLSVKRALVAGQIKPGIPVWKTGSESKFSNIPYVIFPGNVGDKHTLKEAVEVLEQ